MTFGDELEDEIEAELGDVITFNHQGKPVKAIVTEVGDNYWSYMIIGLSPAIRNAVWSIPSYRVLHVDDWVGDLCRI